MSKKQESGRSMIEMLGVLAVIGVLSVGGIYGYTTAMNRHRANELLHQVSMRATSCMAQIAQGSTTLSVSDFDDYDGYSFTAAPVTGQNKFTITISGKEISETVCNNMKNALPSTVHMTNPTECAATNSTITLTYDNGTGGSNNQAINSPILTEMDCYLKGTCASGSECPTGTGWDGSQCRSYWYNWCKSTEDYYYTNNCYCDPADPECTCDTSYFTTIYPNGCEQEDSNFVSGVTECVQKYSENYCRWYQRAMNEKDPDDCSSCANYDNCMKTHGYIYCNCMLEGYQDEDICSCFENGGSVRQCAPEWRDYEPTQSCLNWKGNAEFCKCYSYYGGDVTWPDKCGICLVCNELIGDPHSVEYCSMETDQDCSDWSEY